MTIRAGGARSNAQLSDQRQLLRSSREKALVRECVAIAPGPRETSAGFRDF